MPLFFLYYPEVSCKLQIFPILIFSHHFQPFYFLVNRFGTKLMCNYLHGKILVLPIKEKPKIMKMEAKGMKKKITSKESIVKSGSHLLKMSWKIFKVKFDLWTQSSLSLIRILNNQITNHFIYLIYFNLKNNLTQNHDHMISMQKENRFSFALNRL